MPNSGDDPGVPREPLDDDKIRKKLRSEDEADKTDGLVAVDFQYRKPISEWVKNRYRQHNFQPLELAAIWSLVLLALLKMAGRNKIREHGSLQPLLRTIARFKAIDELRSAGKWHIDDHWDWDLDRFAVERCGDPLELHEMFDAIWEGAAQVKGRDGAVLKLRWAMFLANRKPPTLEKLTARFEDLGFGKVSEIAIKGRLQRGRDKLETILVNRGLINERRK